MVAPNDAKRFLNDLIANEDFFNDTHDLMRTTLWSYAQIRGYEFSLGELEDVLRDHGLAHEQLGLRSRDSNDALGEINRRLEEEDKRADRDRKPRRTEEQKADIRKKITTNVGKWRDEKIPEHVAYTVVHSTPTIG